MEAEDRRRWLALYVLCLGMLMIVLAATIVNVALLPTYAAAPGAGCQEAGMRVVIGCGGCAGSAP